MVYVSVNVIVRLRAIAAHPGNDTETSVPQQQVCQIALTLVVVLSLKMNAFQLMLLYRRKYICRRRLFLLLRLTRKRHIQRSASDSDWNGSIFNLEDYTDRECLAHFRFTRPDLYRLRKALNIPKVVRTRQQDAVDGAEALCILLKRFSYANRWIDLRRMFGRREGTLSRIFHHVLRHIDRRFSRVMQRMDVPWLEEEDFHLYVGAIAGKGGVLPGCFSFVDGTARPIARPKRYQRECFSGHKRQHCIKWQSILLPNGLICNLYGGHKGSMHDSTLLRLSQVVENFQQKLATFQPNNFFIYGDSGYGRGPLLKKPFSRAEIMANPRKGDVNAAMSRVRESVEWGFKEVQAHFAFLNSKQQMKLMHCPINIFYRVCVLLTNCKNCLYRNQASQFFGCRPPSLEIYLSAA